MLTVLLPLLVLATIASIAVAVVRGRLLQEARDAVVTLAQAWSEDGDSRGRVCAAAVQAAGARLALLAEPSPRGDELRVTAAADAREVVGATLPLDDLRLEPEHLPDLDQDGPTGLLLRSLGARSALVHPVVRNGRDVGILVVAWSRPRRELDARRADVVAKLAGEAARAIERDAHVALLSRQARTDELTALPNRRAWDEAVVREMSRAQRTGKPLCMALLDLDHFKAFNDTHGHQAGDAHLRRAAAAWRRELRAIDVLARYGGEEFGILLPDCELDQAAEVLDRVRGATPNGETASAGVVRWDGREAADSLTARADAAMYRAKHAGRSATVTAPLPV